MTAISDQFMQEMLTKTRDYCLVILKEGPNYESPGRDQVIWEHGRRNFSLRAEGILLVVCPVLDKSNIKGIGIFTLGEEETRTIMEGDPAVKEGMLLFEIHPAKGFPGDGLPL